MIAKKENVFHERRYYTTLKMIFLKAVDDIFPEACVDINHTFSKGLYGEIFKKLKLSENDIPLIKNRMDEIISRGYTINLITSNVETLRKKAKNISREDIVRTLQSTGWIPINEYELEGYHDYFYETLYPDTSYIYLYDLIYYEGGFLLRFPIENSPDKIPEFKDAPKLWHILKNIGNWDKIMDVSYIGGLNEKVLKGDIRELIRINETLHEVRLGEIARSILENKNVKLVTVAGPSSSGKTTFSKRLTLHLKSRGVFPIMISLDNYYQDRCKIPLNCHGNKDYEQIEALDLELLNENLKDLIIGKEALIPEYDFYTGERKKESKVMKVPENGIIIIEGIHGLNEKLTENIKRENKFKIYVSCLTQLNIDRHNRIPTNEVRKIRRIVRDRLSRGTDAEKTLSMWNSVRAGEEKNIFQYQEEADVMFDSNLVYELGVLKHYAMNELIKIGIESEYYDEATRLMRFLYCFADIDSKYVPDVSILKEFIGGSYFYDY
ncbi:MAG: nucleoside kinase [Fusobacteriaceae bacterium]